MKNKNGMTIVEMLISILIISIVLALLFNMLSSVRSEDVSNQIQSEFLINQASIIKQVEEDFVDFGVSKISPCNLKDANITNYRLISGYETKYKCIRIDYQADYIDDNIGFLMLYKAYTRFSNKDVGKNESAKWVIQYVRGRYTRRNIGDNTIIKSSWENAVQVMKSYPEELESDFTPYLLYTAAPGNELNAASLVLPIVNQDAEHYDINLSFTFKGNMDFKCNPNSPSLLKCNCKSDQASCNQTQSA